MGFMNDVSKKYRNLVGAAVAVVGFTGISGNAMAKNDSIDNSEVKATKFFSIGDNNKIDLHDENLQCEIQPLDELSESKINSHKGLGFNTARMEQHHAESMNVDDHQNDAPPITAHEVNSQLREVFAAGKNGVEVSENNLFKGKSHAYLSDLHEKVQNMDQSKMITEFGTKSVDESAKEFFDFLPDDEPELPVDKTNEADIER